MYASLKGYLRMYGMKPSSSSSSQSSFIKPLASSLVNFSPKMYYDNINCNLQDLKNGPIPNKLFTNSVSINSKLALTKIGQQSEKFVSKDSSVIVFVVQFQDFNEVMDATLVLGVLDLCENRIKVIKYHDFLALFFHAADFTDSENSGVQVAGPQKVSDVEPIDLAISLEVIHIKGEFDL